VRAGCLCVAAAQRNTSTDAATGKPLNLDYKALTSTTDGGGNLTGVRVEIPPGTALPPRVRLYVIADVFPLAVVERP
jgi:hypothetical protein